MNHDSAHLRHIAQSVRRIEEDVAPASSQGVEGCQRQRLLQRCLKPRII